MRPTSITRWGVLLGVVLAMALASGEALADRATEMKAREAFAAGRYEDALGLFAKLYAETLHPVYLRNIGRCHQKLRQPEMAIDKFNEYLAKEKKIAPDERAEIGGYIKEMEALRDEQKKAAAPPPPAVTPVPPPPPATNPYPPPPSNTTSANLISQPPPPVEDDAPIYKKWWFWTGVGVLVAGGVVAAVALSSGGTTRPPCPSTIIECK